MTTTESPAADRQPSRRAALGLLCGLVLLSSPDAIAGPATPPYVLVLGTAQDGGLPHPACTGPHCARARREPGFRRLVASLALVDPATVPPEVFLVDATPDVEEQLARLGDLRPRGPSPDGRERVDRAPVDGVLLTHAHAGHYLGLASFGYEVVSTHDLPVWATPRMGAYLRGNGPWSQLVDRRNIELRTLAPGESVRLTPRLEVTAFAVPHRDELSDTVGFLVTGPSRRLLYVPDTDRWDSWAPPLLDRLAGVDVALLDGTFYSTDELPGRSVEQIGHPLVRTTMDLLTERVQAGGLAVHFTHLNHSNPLVDPNGPEAAAVRDRGFHVLSDGQTIDL